MPSATPTTSPTPRVIAHRGASGDWPENTLSAFDEALVEGADGIELDIQLTRDDVPVVFHDDTLSKLGLDRKSMSGVTLSELEPLDAGAWRGDAFRGEPVPTLELVLARYGKRCELLLELKGSGKDAADNELVHRTVKMVRRHGVQSNVYLLCFDPRLLSAAHQQAPKLRCVLNALTPAAGLAGARARPWLHAIDVDIRKLKPADGARLLAGGRKLMSYTCNTVQQLRAAQAAGVHAIITNHPAWAREQLEG